MSKFPLIGCKRQILSRPSLEMLADASSIDCAFRLDQHKIYPLSLDQGNLEML